VSDTVMIDGRTRLLRHLSEERGLAVESNTQRHIHLFTTKGDGGIIPSDFLGDRKPLIRKKDSYCTHSALKRWTKRKRSDVQERLSV